MSRALFDTSVWAWAERDPALRAWLSRAIAEDRVACCDPVRLQLLAATRDPAEYRALRAELDALHPCPIWSAEWARALQVYDALAQRGAHRQVPHHALLVAAAAEAAGLPVVHRDDAYEMIGSVTGQAMRRARPDD